MTPTQSLDSLSLHCLSDHYVDIRIMLLLLPSLLLLLQLLSLTSPDDVTPGQHATLGHPTGHCLPTTLDLRLNTEASCRPLFLQYTNIYGL